jgi:uncharacterized membrane protein
LLLVKVCFITYKILFLKTVKKKKKKKKKKKQEKKKKNLTTASMSPPTTAIDHLSIQLKLVLGCLSHHHAVDAENATVLSPGLAAVAGARATKSITVKVFATSATRSASAVRDACDTALV